MILTDIDTATQLKTILETELSDVVEVHGFYTDWVQQINASRRPYYTIPLSKAVDVSSLTGVSNNAPTQKVGYRSSVGWYRKFVDHGTTKQKAQKFTDKSRKKIAEIAKDEFTKVAKEVLEP